MEEGRTWILRATVDTDVFRSLVENIRVGRTGEVFLVQPGRRAANHAPVRRPDHGARGPGAFLAL